MITPKFVPIVSVAAVVSLVLVAVLAWQVTRVDDAAAEREQRAAAAEEQRDCERAVSNRDDGRAMWLYLIGEAKPDQTPEEQERFDAFVAELNKRLPPLKCVDGNPVPDTDPDA